jgi:hypothetical protein
MKKKRTPAEAEQNRLYQVKYRQRRKQEIQELQMRVQFLQTEIAQATGRSRNFGKRHGGVYDIYDRGQRDRDPSDAELLHQRIKEVEGIIEFNQRTILHQEQVIANQTQKMEEVKNMLLQEEQRIWHLEGMLHKQSLAISFQQAKLGHPWPLQPDPLDPWNSGSGRLRQEPPLL